MPYRYQPVILDELARFGVFPTEDTPPALVHEFINDLYRFELRRLRERRLFRDAKRPHVEWRLPREGWDLARRLPPGVTGWGRAARGDRGRDRYAQVRDGAVQARKDAPPST